jgi:hypothetical protein
MEAQLVVQRPLQARERVEVGLQGVELFEGEIVDVIAGVSHHSSLDNTQLAPSPPQNPI